MILYNFQRSRPRIEMELPEHSAPLNSSSVRLADLDRSRSSESSIIGACSNKAYTPDSLSSGERSRADSNNYVRNPALGYLNKGWADLYHNILVNNKNAIFTLAFWLLSFYNKFFLLFQLYKKVTQATK